MDEKRLSVSTVRVRIIGVLEPQLPAVAGAAEDFAGQGVGHLAGLNYRDAVDKYVLHSNRELIRVFKGRAVGDGVGVEYDDVGPHADFEDSAIAQPHLLSGQRRELPNGFFERQFLFLTNIFAENSRKCTVGPRVRMFLAELAVGRRALRVVADRYPWLLEGQSNVALVHSKDRNVDVSAILNQ